MLEALDRHKGVFLSVFEGKPNQIQCSSMKARVLARAWFEGLTAHFIRAHSVKSITPKGKEEAKDDLRPTGSICCQVGGRTRISLSRRRRLPPKNSPCTVIAQVHGQISSSFRAHVAESINFRSPWQQHQRQRQQQQRRRLENQRCDSRGSQSTCSQQLAVCRSDREGVLTS